MGSGSSAVTDLLMEFKGFDAPHGSFEYIFLHCPNGVFDLEDKLLVGNNAIRSDEALHSFRATMKELYNNPLWWPGRYKQRLSRRFMNHVDDYIDALTLITSDNYWYQQENRGVTAIPRLSAHMACKLFSKGHLAIKKPLLYQEMRLSIPTAAEFYGASRQFLTTIFHDLGVDRCNLILDQLLLPFNAWRMENYFDSNATCIIVDRDPRDVFLLNKYVWGPVLGTPVPYPTEVHSFCEYYARMRESEKPTDNAHVLRIHFEDLVYNYEESVRRIASALGLSSHDHIRRQTRFDPNASIENTQLFRLDEFKDETLIIDSALPAYEYDFPYTRKPERTNCS